MALTIETRALILDSKHELISPNTHDALTFVNHIDIDQVEQTGKSMHELVETGLKDSYDIWPVLTRRALGSIGTTRAYLITPGLGKNPERNFTWRRHQPESVSRYIADGHSSYDETDVEIFRRFVDLGARGELGPIALGNLVEAPRLQQRV